MIYVFYRFKKWAVLCRRPDLVNLGPEVCFRRYKLCSDHFKPELFNNNRLSYNAMPSIFNWSLETNKPNKLKVVKGILLIFTYLKCINYLVHNIIQSYFSYLYLHYLLFITM